MRKINFAKEKSFSLLEMIFTVFVLTVGIVGTYGAIIRSMSHNTYLSQRLIASYLAQEGIETARNIRDGNWLDGQAWDYGVYTVVGGGGAVCDVGCEADYAENTTLVVYGTGRYLYIDDTDKLYKYITVPAAEDIKTKFKRKITVTNSGSALTVKVDVFWDSNSFSAQEKLYNWK